ncbi:efflux RND transporter permease subunit [Clostridium sp. Marseille-P2415]|uniref:efflux RND transporter permease subunit n=1 Tax=Clostridium sp. Marseille-P2415 TaxID=1805471 RepID=UPI00098847D6|nr:efflux RND transporter permease subunit [Clostridium sp. Marseille-P2415]
MKKGYVSIIIKKKFIVLIIVAMIAISGMISYLSIPKQHFPEVVLPVASVSVVYPGASAEDMEELVTKKLEEVIRETEGFDSCTSTTMNSVSAVMVSLSMDISQKEVDESFDDLRNRLQELKASLPSGVTSVSIDTDIMETAGMIVAVTGNGFTGDELAERTDDLKDQLKLLEGVRKVEVYGQQKSEAAIHVDADRLNALDVSLSEIANIIGAQNSIIPTGTIDVDDSVMTVNSNGKFESLDEIRNIVIGQSEAGTVIRLSDVADIQIQSPEDSAHYTYNSEEANLIALYFNSGINVVDFGDSIRQCIGQYHSSTPSNIQVNEVYFQPDVVSDAVNNFLWNLLESVLLVLVVVMLGMNFRNGLVVSIAIPLSILINFIVMKIMGTQIQFVSLAALIIVLGMLVDNAIVISDSIQTKLDQGKDRVSAAIEGTQEMVVPVFISMLTTVSAFASLLALSGAYRQLAFTLPVVIITCLAASFLVSLLVTPLFSYLFLKPAQVKKDGSQKLAMIYDRLFEKAFRHKKRTILIALIFMAVCALTLPIIDMQVIPKAYKDVVTIDLKGSDENDIKKTEAVIRQIEGVLDEQPETRYYLSGIGTGIPRYDFSVMPKSTGKNIGDIFVKVDLSKGGRFKETHEMVDFLQNELDAKIGGGTVLVDELGIFAFTSKPIEMKVYSEDLDDLNQAAETVAGLMRQLEGTKYIDAGQEISTYNYYVNMDTKKLNSLGLTKAEVQNELSIALMGRDVSLYRNQGKEYEIKLDSNIEAQNSMKNYRIKSSASQNKYALQQFAELELNPEISAITRIDGRRGRAVGCYYMSKYSDITLQMKLEKMLETAKFPDGVTLEKSGMKHDFMDVLTSIAGVAVLSAAIIFMILLFQFNSIRIPLLIFISVPFGVLSGVAGLFITGERLTFFALLGAVSLLGCVLANAIVLVEFINEERAAGATVDEACRAAGQRRFRPILMSTMTTVLGLIPLGFGGDALFVPMARLMMAGLAVAMVINLILVPIVYDILE